MIATDFISLLPLLLIAGTSVIVMLAVGLRRNHVLTVVLSLAGLAGAFRSLWAAASVAPRQVSPLLIIDRYALFYTGLIIAGAFAVVVLSYSYLERHDTVREEFYVLLLISTLGAAVLVSSSHFFSFFLGLETLSVPLYALIAYLQSRRISLEAGLKYLVLAAASASFLLFGMALVYVDLGTMEFASMAAALAGGLAPGRTLVLPGLALIVTGIGFKLGVVPFHMWTPDVYEGAPAPVTAFIATVSKGGMFALLLRYFDGSGAHGYGPVFLVFSIIAIGSMIAGNILALLQTNVKRILAYSSIAHLGYVLVAFQAGGSLSVEAVTFYLVAYFVTTLGAFGVVSAVSGNGRDADALENYRGLFWRRPAVAGIFTVMLLSLAGIPLTAGFIGKFYVVAASASASIWTLVLILVSTSAIGLVYYLRVVAVMYARSGEPAPTLSVRPSGAFVLAALAILLIWFGVYPEPLLRVIRSAVAGLI